MTPCNRCGLDAAHTDAAACFAALRDALVKANMLADTQDENLNRLHYQSDLRLKDALTKCADMRRALEQTRVRVAALERVAEAARVMSKRYEHWYDGRGPGADSAEHDALMDALAALAPQAPEATTATRCQYVYGDGSRCYSASGADCPAHGAAPTSTRGGGGDGDE